MISGINNQGRGKCYQPKPNWLMLSMHISSYGCTREVWRAREKSKSCSSSDTLVTGQFMTVTIKKTSIS